MNARCCILIFIISLTTAALIDETTYDAGYDMEAMIGCSDYLYIWGQGKIVTVEMFAGEQPKLITEVLLPQITTQPTMKCGDDVIVVSTSDVVMLLDASSLAIELEVVVKEAVSVAITTSTVAAVLENGTIAVWNTTSGMSESISSPVVSPIAITSVADDYLIVNSTTAFSISPLGELSDGFQITEFNLNLSTVTDLVTQPNGTSAYHISNTSVLTYLPDIEKGSSWSLQLENITTDGLVVLSSGDKIIIAGGNEIRVLENTPPQQPMQLYVMESQNDITGIAYISSMDVFVYSSGSSISVVRQNPTTLVPGTGAPDTPFPDTPAPTLFQQTTSAADESHLAWVIPVVVVSVLIAVFVLYLLYKRFISPNEPAHISEALLPNSQHTSPRSQRDAIDEYQFVVDDLAPKVGASSPLGDGLGHPPLHTPVADVNITFNNGSNASTPIGSPIPGIVAGEKQPVETSTFNNPQVLLPAMNPLVNTTGAAPPADMEPENCLIVDTEKGVVVGETSSPIKLGSPAAISAAPATAGPLFSAASSPPRPILPTPSAYSRSVLSTPSQISGPPLSLTRQQFVTPPKSVLDDLNLSSPTSDIRQIERNFEKSRSPEDHIALVHAKQEENDRLDKVLQLARVGYDVSGLL